MTTEQITISLAFAAILVPAVAHVVRDNVNRFREWRRLPRDGIGRWPDRMWRREHAGLSFLIGCMLGVVTLGLLAVPLVGPFAAGPVFLLAVDFAFP